MASDEIKEGWREFVNEFIGESDRGAGIVGAAALDDLLMRVIKSYLGLDEELASRFVGSDFVPVGSFSERILTARCLGLIDDDSLRVLTVIRRIRNLFAHDLGLDFDTAPISDHCDRLAGSDGLPISTLPNSSRRDVFISTVSHLHGKFRALLVFVDHFRINGGFPTAFRLSNVDVGQIEKFRIGLNEEAEQLRDELRLLSEEIEKSDD